MSKLIDTEVFEEVINIRLQVIQFLGNYLHSGSLANTIHLRVVIVCLSKISHQPVCSRNYPGLEVNRLVIENRGIYSNAPEDETGLTALQL